MLSYLDRLINADQGGITKRKPCAVKDSSASTLPADGSASITADSQTLKVGDRVLYTALSDATKNNKVYIVDHFLGGGLHMRVDADGINADGSGHPGEFVHILEGTSEDQLMGFEDDSWTRVDFSGSSSASFTGSLVGDVTGTQGATVVSLVGGSSATNVHNAELAANAATSANTASTIMKRSSGGHAAIGVMELASVSVSDLASGGSIGSAASTVDVASVALVTQTTAAQTLTLPSPTSAGPIRQMLVANTGSVSFTMLSTTVTAGSVLNALWNGSSWMAVL